LHNFGGRINLHGDLAYIATNPFIEAKQKYPQASGMGLFMEGIEQNPVFYDFVFDMIWRNESVEICSWLKDYVARRYGVQCGAALEAWKILLKTAYRDGTNEVESSSIVAARPALDVKKSGPNDGFKIPYEPADLAEAWKLLLSAERECGKSDGYLFDLVDVGRQVLSNLGQTLHKSVRTAFENGNLKEFDEASEKFLELLSEIDMLLENRREYRFSEWLDSAKAWGTDDAEKKQYAKNAAMLVTLWGPEENPCIFDYSWREWSGLIRGFYLLRWEKFHSFLREKLQKGEAYSETGLPQVFGREAWRANEFYSKLADWEAAWVNNPEIGHPEIKSDKAFEISEKLYGKWCG
jgi:alpha-N-acetylglucosaminidase